MCEICKHSPCLSLCPNYIPPKAKHYCSFCKEGIYEGEEYIENLNGEYRHFECFAGMRDLLEWLGYRIKIMGDTYGRDY